jgi:uncharacterized protein
MSSTALAAARIARDAGHSDVVRLARSALRSGAVSETTSSAALASRVRVVGDLSAMLAGPARTRERLSAALRAALRARNSVAVAALRSAMAAIDSAEAVNPDGLSAQATGDLHLAGAVEGLRAAEVARRGVGETEVGNIVRAEVTDRRAVARDYTRRGRPDCSSAY